MKEKRKRNKIRTILTWGLWVLIAQVFLINISAALYAEKLTHLQMDSDDPAPVSQNLVESTWSIFTGPTLHKRALTRKPEIAYSTVELKTKSGLKIEAWLFRADSIANGWVILVHGLTGNKGMIIDEAYAFREMGYHTMLVDLRSHGNSEGSVTTLGFEESEEVSLAYAYLKQAGEQRIFIWGASMGAVAVIKAVAEDQLTPAGIIVEMPFLSLQSHLESRGKFLGFPRQPFGFLVSLWIGIEQGFNGIAFNAADYAKKVQCPVLMQYGAKDVFVRPYETNALFNVMGSSNKKLVIYDQAAHESFLRNDPVTWKREIGSFVN